MAPLNQTVAADAPPDPFVRPPIPASLQGIVADLCGFRDRVTAGTYTVPATSKIPLILAFGSPVEVHNVGGAQQPGLFKSFTAGLFPGYTVLRPAGPQWGIRVDLTAAGAFRILGIPGLELARQVVDLEDVAPRQLTELPGRLALMDSWSERFELVEATLVALAASGSPFDPSTDWALSRIVDSGGTLKIADLVRQAGWSHRYFTSLFRRQVGLTPKALASVVRFERTTAVLTRHRPGLARAANECGYADQSHLIREFRRFAGSTPAAKL